MAAGRLRLLLKLIDGFVDLVNLLRLIFALRIARIIARVAIAATVTTVALIALNSLSLDLMSARYRSVPRRSERIEPSSWANASSHQSSVS